MMKLFYGSWESVTFGAGPTKRLKLATFILEVDIFAKLRKINQLFKSIKIVNGHGIKYFLTKVRFF
jgi:hypothetical protein